MQDIKFYPVHPADASSILLILSFSMNTECQGIFHAIALVGTYINYHPIV